MPGAAAVSRTLQQRDRERLYGVSNPRASEIRAPVRAAEVLEPALAQARPPPLPRRLAPDRRRDGCLSRGSS